MKGVYIVGGYPDLNGYVEILKILSKSRVDFIEIGLPFNDPVADGEAITDAILKACENNLTIDTILEKAINILNDKIIIPMTYSNIIFSYGVKKFSEKFKNKIHSIIIADLPNRMHNFFYNRGFKIPIIPFITLETRDNDLKLINRLKSDLSYFIGIRGTTGGKLNFNDKELKSKILKVKNIVNKKIIFGFGLKNKSDIEKALTLTDACVIGTEIVKHQRDLLLFNNFLKSLEFL